MVVDELHKIVDDCFKGKDEEKLHFTFIVEDVNRNFSYSGKNSYMTYLTALSVLIEMYMNDAVPKYGKQAVVDMKAVINKTIELNKALPDDETERALYNLNKALEMKPESEQQENE